MYTPTELLKLYLRDAFNKESVPAAPDDLKTWDRERLRLGRNVLGILQPENHAVISSTARRRCCWIRSSRGLTDLYDAFSEFFERSTSSNLTDAYQRLTDAKDDSNRVRSLLSTAGLRPSRVSLTLEEAARLLDGAPALQEELRQLGERIDAGAHNIGNRVLHEHPGLLAEIVAAGPQLAGEEAGDDDEIDDPDDSVEARNPWRELRPEGAAQFFLDSIRRRAAAVSRQGGRRYQAERDEFCRS